MRRLTIARLWLLASLAGGGCATEVPFEWASAQPAPLMPRPDQVVIRPRDTIVVVVPGHREVSGEFVVREDGGVALADLGDAPLANLSIEKATAELQRRLSTMIVNATVTLSISKPAPIRVNVVGEVKTPASYELARDRSVMAALAAAGWLTEFADRTRIFVVHTEGTVTKRLRFRSSEITSPDPAAPRFQLNDGDVVVVE